MKNQSWMMMVCCLMPVLIFFVLPAIGFNRENLSWILIPVMLLVFFMMMRKGGGCCGGHDEKKPEGDTKEEHKKHGCH
jgi:hypothetical protein